jgi:hypothetical protein
MMNSRAVFAAGAVFLSAALAVSYFQVAEPTVKATEVLTWDCELPEYKPKAITLTCASGGFYVDQITWNTWSEEGATGSGIFHENLCNPSCAEGESVSEAVNVTLTELTPRKEKFYLRTLDIKTVSGKDFTWGRAGTHQWDVMEFAEMMRKGK